MTTPTIKLSMDKKVHTIDMTPTWSGILPALELALMHGSAEGRKMAREELARMAALADRYVAEHKGKVSI